jgi:phosphohistidine phosphatase
VLRLTLIRHANAEWKDASIADFDRPLNKRGLGEADALGKILLENELVPELMLMSTARRTQQTAEILAKVLSLPARRVKPVEPLYLARNEVILTLAQTTGPNVKHLAIVGHNPGISELAGSLAGEGAAITELSTGAACTLTFNARSWAQIASPAERAVQHTPPAKLLDLFN